MGTILGQTQTLNIEEMIGIALTNNPQIKEASLRTEKSEVLKKSTIDFGKTIVTHSKYLDLLQKAGNQLKILPHKVKYCIYFVW